MNILQVIRSADTRGGGPIEGLMQQGAQLTARGHTVETLALDPPGMALDSRLEERTVHLLGPARLGYGYTPRLVPWLRAHVREYDVIVIHGMWQYHGYATAKVCRELGVPYVIFLHGMLDPWFNRRYPLKKLKKWLYWPWAEYRVLRDARYVLFTTEEELRLARESFWLYRARERLVGYGIEARSLPIGEAREIFLSAHPNLRGKRLLLYLSRIHPKKGCDMLLDAFSKLAGQDPALHLVLAGPGDEGWISQLKQQAEDLGLQRQVSFPGMLRGAMKWGAYDAAEVFVLPSHQENFGIVIAEALASRLPVLTTRQVNIWRPIQADGAGLIESDTPLGTHKLLSRWLALSETRKGEMAEDALTCFANHFEIGRVVGNLERALVDTKEQTQPVPFTFIGNRRLPNAAISS